MPTRYYFNRATPGSSPTPAGAWDDTAGLVRGSLTKTKDTLASTSINRAETSTDPAFDVLLGQWVSDPLDSAQTISGTFDLAISAFETAADANMVLHVHVWVTQGNTSTPRGTLLSDFIDATELPTTEAGVAIAQQTLSGVAAQVGDRIVVEVGYRATNVTATSKSGRVRHGGNDATDQSAGDTTTSHPGWCEFGTAITDAETRISPATLTKLYLGGSGQDTTAVPPAIRGTWDSTGSVTLAGADQLTAATPGVASSTIALSTGSTAANFRRLLKVFVSPPLNAGTLAAQTWHITGLTLEAAADQDIVWAWHLYVMKANGDVRATLASSGADADADNEWPTGTAAGRRSDAISVPSQAITQDDRLVLEVGGKQLGTPAASGNLTIRQGGTGGDAAPGDTDTAKPTWIGALVTATPRSQAVFVG